ncbi:MAG: efflux RND transporter permease subunit [Acidobacteria bacterium]|nr:efflux RND transporter permease subunit [Acidobacteriota bacterium]
MNGGPAPRGAGRIAAAFLQSKLTPLIIVASILLGGFAVWQLPREEEPQIVVPMIDVFVEFPGASAKEVEQRVTIPMENLLWEIPGVEYIYSTSSPGSSLAVVRFYVGENEEASIVRLNQKLQSNFDLIPPGASYPLVKLRSIDDIPILALTLWSRRYTDLELRQVAAQLRNFIKQVSDVSAVEILGGQRRQVRVLLDPARLAAHNLTPLEIAGQLDATNLRLRSGEFARANQEFRLEAGNLLERLEDVRQFVIGTSGGRPLRLAEAARVEEGGEEPTQYVRFAAGRAADFELAEQAGAGRWPAVTLTVAKRKGKNAITVAEAVLAKVEAVREASLPSDVHLSLTRNYAETAREKSNELLFHMFLAVVSVSVLIGIVLGFREAGIVLVAIPVTLALTLAVFYFYGYTLNRITLFALIFSIGILVDDAIVVVENIVRHARLQRNQGRSLAAVAVEAVEEVGNPTILATLAVVAALLPMAFVGGLMGPYMRPIPIGASAAMAFSLIVAFVVTPWAAVRLLRREGEHAQGEEEDRLTRLYRRLMRPLVYSPRWRWLFLAGIFLLLVAACSLLAIRFVKVKMLPFDNKSEFQVIVDMPEGTTLEHTTLVAERLGEIVGEQPEVTHYQVYAGTASPFNFNGLVRHYFLRRGSNVADIQVNLVSKSERRLQSHDIAKRVRDQLLPVAAKYGANIKVAEVPPGPPVLQTLVAEIYGPDAQGRLDLARQVREIFENTPGVVDTDWYVEDDQEKIVLDVDQEKAALAGISTGVVAQTLRLAASGQLIGLLHDEVSREDVPILLRLDRVSRSEIEQLKSLRLRSGAGKAVPVSELVNERRTVTDRSIYHKNLMPVVYVTGDVAGELESPVYAILQMAREIDRIPIPGGYSIEQYTASQPFLDQRYAMKWDGEWHITYEVFRDLGIAFAAVLVLIYILVVGWFRSFWIPVVILLAIPFSLVGILPAHGLLNAFFTATSMIGFIAGAGIVVRNSIILVDFIELRRKEGMPLAEAVIDAGAVRFRPMVLTAAAVVVAAGVILFDPIFQGLAISLMAGEIASLLLSRMTVPIVYYLGAAHWGERPAPPPA